MFVEAMRTPWYPSSWFHRLPHTRRSREQDLGNVCTPAPPKRRARRGGKPGWQALDVRERRALRRRRPARARERVDGVHLERLEPLEALAHERADARGKKSRKKLNEERKKVEAEHFRAGFQALLMCFAAYTRRAQTWGLTRRNDGQLWLMDTVLHLLPQSHFAEHVKLDIHPGKPRACV